MLPLLAFVVSAAVVTLGTGPSPRAPEYPHVRSSDPRIAHLIDTAARRSPTFARVHAALQRTDVILFVERSAGVPRALHGRLRLVTATPLARYLLAEIRPDLSRGDLLAAIAHEMQHALEIGQETGVRDARSLDALYRRIGSSPRSGQYDTHLANDIGARVRLEAL